MKTRVFIVRHTETIGNVEKRLTGRQDYEITERGQVLIQKLTKELEKIKFDRAYSSTSRRAIKTIEPIVEKQNLKIEESDELCEMYFGIYDGWKWEDVNKIQPEIKQTQNEINEIEQACDAPYNGCKAHIEKAVGFLADREHKDYKNCIKESISAVETICQIIIGSNTATLNKAIQKLKNKGIKIHPVLETAFTKLYAYTSDEGGIRHAEGLFVSEVSFEEAKFMLVSCSAFVNYLIAEYGKIVKD